MYRAPSSVIKLCCKCSSSRTRRGFALIPSASRRAPTLCISFAPFMRNQRNRNTELVGQRTLHNPRQRCKNAPRSSIFSRRFTFNAFAKLPAPRSPTVFQDIYKLRTTVFVRISFPIFDADRLSSFLSTSWTFSFSCSSLDHCDPIASIRCNFNDILIQNNPRLST